MQSTRLWEWRSFAYVELCWQPKDICDTPRMTFVNGGNSGWLNVNGFIALALE